jgi:thioredoxin 1
MSLSTDKHLETVVLPVGEQNFATEVLNAALPVIVEFTAEWCPPCRVLAPLYARLAHEYSGKVVFASLDVDEHPSISARYGVQGVPTLVVFHAGKEVTRLVGPHPVRLRATLERELARYSLV